MLADWRTECLAVCPLAECLTCCTFNIIDNVASKVILSYLEEAKIGVQLVEPHNHRVNAAERAIQTFKNLFISGLSTCDDSFPTILWSRLVKQCQDSCNMLQTSRVHPKISAYHCLEGIHDFNRVPWAPPGTRAEGRTPRGASAASMLTSLPPPPVPLFLWGRALYTAAPSAACFSSRSGWRPAGTGDGRRRRGAPRAEDGRGRRTWGALRLCGRA